MHQQLQIPASDAAEAAVKASQHAASMLFDFMQACAYEARRHAPPKYMDDNEVFEMAAQIVQRFLDAPGWRTVRALKVARQAGQWAYLKECGRL